MAKSPKKKPGPVDLNQLAKSIVDRATDETPALCPKEESAPPADGGKNPAAVQLGRLGGLKGGKARAAALSKKKRADIAKKAAQARWGKPKTKD